MKQTGFKFSRQYLCIELGSLPKYKTPSVNLKYLNLQKIDTNITQDNDLWINFLKIIKKLYIAHRKSNTKKQNIILCIN